MWSGETKNAPTADIQQHRYIVNHGRHMADTSDTYMTHGRRSRHMTDTSDIRQTPGIQGRHISDTWKTHSRHMGDSWQTLKRHLSGTF